MRRGNVTVEAIRMGSAVVIRQGEEGQQTIQLDHETARWLLTTALPAALSEVHKATPPSIRGQMELDECIAMAEADGAIR